MINLKNWKIIILFLAIIGVIAVSLILFLERPEDSLVTQEDCELKGYYWYDNTCHEEPKVERELAPEDFKNQQECEQEGFYWYDNTCHEESEIEPETTTIEKANNEFALKLYSELIKEEENIFFSPYSISTALAMTYEGAKGKTAEEMESVFGFFKEDQERRKAIFDLHERLNPKEEEYELNTSNALWIAENYELLEEYIQVIKDYYHGIAQNIDFEDPEKAAEIINDFVEEKTRGLIEDLISPEFITPLTRLILTNTIYFKGDWVQEFDEELTEDEEFSINETETVKVPMMRKRGETWKYYENEDIQVLELPYDGEKISMRIILPQDKDLASLEEKLTLDLLKEWQEKIQKEKVHVYIPRFELDTDYELNRPLIELGLPSAFSEIADFSGITGAKDLFIGFVVHDAFVSVDEVGTEAAAATAVGMEEAVSIDPPPVPVFRADHPFIFLIQEIESDNILFMGRVIDPSY